MCVSGYISKNIRVGWLLFFFQNVVIIFPDINKKHKNCVVCPKHILKRGLFVPDTMYLSTTYVPFAVLSLVFIISNHCLGRVLKY